MMRNQPPKWRWYFNLLIFLPIFAIWSLTSFSVTIGGKRIHHFVFGLLFLTGGTIIWLVTRTMKHNALRIHSIRFTGRDNKTDLVWEIVPLQMIMIGAILVLTDIQDLIAFVSGG